MAGESWKALFYMPIEVWVYPGEACTISPMREKLLIPEE
jgi:hypothetical protein